MIEWRDLREQRKKKVNNIPDPVGKVPCRNSVIEEIHRIRIEMSGSGPLIPLHEVMRRIVEHWIASKLDRSA